MRILHCCFHKISEKHGCLKDTFIFLVDLKGAAMMKLLSTDVIKIAKLLTQSTADFFPEVMYKTFFINAPMMFTLCWKIAKVWLDEKVAKKINILGTSYKKELYKEIEEDKIPTICGGTCPAGLLEGHPDRPWKDYLNECLEKKTYFADGVKISNPENKYLEVQRLQK